MHTWLLEIPSHSSYEAVSPVSLKLEGLSPDKLALKFYQKSITLKNLLMSVV